MGRRFLAVQRFPPPAAGSRHETGASSPGNSLAARGGADTDPREMPNRAGTSMRFAGIDLAYEAIRVHYAAYQAAEEGRRITL